ncbi:hypothetical protein D3C74_312640 [compost metagenome]
MVVGRVGRAVVTRVVDRDRAVPEVGDPDLLAVAVEAAVGPEDLRLAVVLLREGGHGERRRSAALELHRDDLVVHDVVVRGVDAPPVVARAQRLDHRGLVGAVGDDRDGPDRPLLAQRAQVQAGSRVRAGRLERAVQAAVRGALGALLGPEVLERAEARDRRDPLARDVADPVQVVARLREQHGARRLLRAPRSAHVRVRVVPPADRLEVLHVDDLAQDARVDDRLHEVRVRHVAHDVAHAEQDTRGLDRVDDVATLLGARCERLLDQDRVALRRERHDRVAVLTVLGRDDDHVGEAGGRARGLVARCDQGLPVRELRDGGGVGVRRCRAGRHERALERARVGDRDQAGTVGVRGDPACVGLTTVAGAHEGDGHGCIIAGHERSLLRCGGCGESGWCGEGPGEYGFICYLL